MPFYCGVYGHAGGDDKLPKFLNVTQVPAPTGSGSVAAYERFTPDGAPLSCEAHNCSPGVAPCGPWIGVDTGVNSKQYSMVPGQPNTAPQTFDASTDTVNFAVCHKRGFKNAAAVRNWHGMYGFTSHDQPGGYPDAECAALTTDSNGKNPGDPGYITTYSYTYYENYSATPDQTKYTEIAFNCTITGSYNSDWSTTLSGGGTGDHATKAVVLSVSVAGTFTVDPHSGEIKVTSWAITNNNSETDYDADSGITTVTRPANLEDFTSIGLGGLSPVLLSDNPLDYFNLPANRLYLIKTTNESIEAWQQAFSLDAQTCYGTQGGTQPCTYPARTISLSNTELQINFQQLCSPYTYTIPNPYPGGGTLTETFGMTFDVSCTIQLSAPNTGADVYADAQGLLGNWPLNDDALYPWRTDSLTQIAPLVGRLEKGESAPSLFTPTTTNDLRNPIADVNGNGPFTTSTSPGQHGGATVDGSGYNPYTTNVWPPPAGWTYINGQAGAWIPTYATSPTLDWIPTYSQIPTFDAGIYQFQFATGQTSATAAATALVKLLDGSVTGAPNPAGYQDYFRFDFSDYRGCCDSTTGAFEAYIYGYGMFVSAFNAQTGAQLPVNAANWTSYTQCANKSGGASLAYLDQTTSAPPDCNYSSAWDLAFWAYKYAECGETWQSVNFARPGGADKFLIDETQVYCYAAGVLYQQDAVTPAAGLNLTGTWGGASVNGFFNGATTDGSGNLTLGAKQFNLPSDWHSASGDDASAFGKLRFPTAPSLLGRASIKPDATGEIMTFGAAQTSFGMAVSGTEAVDLYDGNMALLASSVTATRVSDSVFTVPAAYLTAAWVMIHGAPAWPQSDNYPKGDFIYLTWLSDIRTNGEAAALSGKKECDGVTPVPPPTPNLGYAAFSQTADALPIVQCAPRVVCFSPNGETWTNGKTYAFPATFALDGKYGGSWKAAVLFNMTDPFWQTPHKPCGSAIGWAVDASATCPADTGTKAYYALAPQCEARLTVPAGFPALPAGVTLGFLSPVTNSSGDVAYMPPPNGWLDPSHPCPVNTPWQLAINLCADLAGGCRFDYSPWVVGCPPATP